MKVRIALSLGLLAACNSATKTEAIQPGEIIGRIEISDGVPASSCQVLLEGTPLGAKCDEDGVFDVRKVPPGRWDLRVITDGAATAIPAKRIAAAANPGIVSDVGAVPLAKPGSVGGHVINAGGTDLSVAVIAVPEVGAVTAPNMNNGYLLDAVAPGVHEIVLITDAGTVIRQNVNVLPGKVTIGADLDLMMLQPNMVNVIGHAVRADAAGGADMSGITVELVENVNGQVKGTATTDGNGSFTIQAQYGTYIVRAHDGANPATAIIPSVVVRGSSDVALTSALSVQPKDGDLDGDGVTNDKDSDIDGDGVPNMMDAFPYDPAETQDTDADGVGDRSDLKSMGGNGIDHKNPTPDTDMDGKLDFEDNCPMTPNPDQKDSDGDGVGDACDNCPFVPNPDQADSVPGSPIGDACRFCKQNIDCGAGKICQFGQCVDCIANSQCGDQVCDVAAGKCVGCDATHLCGGTQHCDTSTSRCVDCLTSSDCMAGYACQLNHCFPQCTSDASCPTGQFCVSGACSQCRSSADCTGTQYCQNGLCMNQCLTSNDCTGGRACDPTTHTCVLPCNGMCMNGQTCSNSVCLTICNLTQPCPTGQICSMQGTCGPECVTTADCASKPFTTCMAGMCVHTSACATDLDCASMPGTNCLVAVGQPTGTCVARPTAKDSNGFYTCAQTCDCSTGETCVSGECKPDPLGVPTMFLSATIGTTSGDGKSPATASSVLGPLSTAASGAVVAVDANGTINVTAPQPINSAGVTLAGGYVTCAPNRWVRDDSQRSTIANTSTSGKGILNILGTPSVPLSNVTVYGMNFSVADNTGPGSGSPWQVINATQAPGLTAKHLTFSFVPMSPNASRTVQGLFCSNCTNVVWQDLYTPSYSQPQYSGDQMHFVELLAGSGSIQSVHVGASAMSELWAVRVSNTVGSVTIDSTKVDSMAGVGTQNVGFVGVYVQNAPSGTITVTNSNLPFVNSTSGNYGFGIAGIAVQSAVQIAVSKNTVDGSAVAATSSSTSQTAFSLLDTNGTVDSNTIKFPQLYAGNCTNTGFHIGGPAAGLTITNNQSSGGQAYTVYLFDVENPNVTSGPVVISKNNMAGQLVGNGYAYGLRSHNNNYAATPAIIFTDNTLNIPAAASGQNPYLYPFNVDSSIVRIERNKIYTGATGGLIASVFNNASVVELYDNFLSHGVNNNYSRGIDMEDSASVIYAIGNTIDPGGAGSQGTSAGIYQAGSVNPADVIVSNLISGGRSLTHFMAQCSSGATPCWSGAAANAKSNYFWFPAGTQNSSEEAYSLTGGSTTTTPNNGNMVDATPTNGCYDPAYTQPDYHILATSVCIDKGATGTRRDASAITQDVDMMSRTLGAAPDIGCSEKM